MRQLNRKVWPYRCVLKDVYDRDANGYLVPQRADGGKIINWCNDRIGKKEWYYYREKNDMIYAFKDEEALLLFKITWRHNGS
jgi:hypothetical protein